MAPVAGPSGEIALLKQLRDDQGRWEASVKINSQAVPIYKVEHKEEKTTCYIEAVEDAEFTVTFMKAKMTATDLAAWLKVDGTRVDGFSIPIHDMGGHVDTFEGARISATAIRPFKFAKIALTDEPDMASTSEQVVKNLGTIQIAICRTQILGKSLASAAYSDYKQHVVDEKSKKATMSHSTSYGAAKVKVASGTADSVQYIDPIESPWHTLEFKYRSRALLELENIVKPVNRESNTPEAPTSFTTSPDAGKSASGSNAGRNKRKGSALSLSDSEEDEDIHAKIARLEAENERLRVKNEDVKPKLPKGEPIGKIKHENGRVVLDLLDEDD
ncbi:hypothetical protein Rhopal_004549-T1 [Rhodotorula paludigena]|uniref:DUF7918 domain-containing protein n=1 Tax=Rhodotorula paludigena TaxID=86838 RepID=A0AAV5GPR3_9BASI|nr:hypothetical protein Rhopal_004549-T1 [Rhodotorula paludigena]